jgi:hypothetical protein
MTETAETVLKVGDRVRAIQCGEDKQPREGGKILAGTVTAAEGAYYSVAYDDRSVYTGRHDPYWKGTLWRAWCWEYWKLEPIMEADTTTGTGEDQ